MAPPPLLASPSAKGPTPYYSAVILAAGRASRIGTPKLLLPLDGRPLLQFALDAVAASCLSEIVLVIGPELQANRGGWAAPSEKPFRVVENPDPDAGQSRSLQLGLKATRPEARAAAIVLADEPTVTPSHIDRVARLFKDCDQPAARPVYCSPPEPPVPGHPVFVARRLWSEIDELRGDQGLRDLFTESPERLFEIESQGPAPRDIDTWDDYEAAGGIRPASN